ncbi:hypothetical protein N0S44_000248 [Escherichia coli]|nr:hypothetical protein [Escherichia coli]EJR1979093.1 hypothetical protein [Escherichia coli]
MFKNFIVIVAVLFGASCFISPVHAEEQRQTIKTIGTGKTPPKRTAEEYMPEMRERYRQTYREKHANDKPIKKHKWEVVKSPSFCAGYAKVKVEQHKNQYYKDMYYFYNSRISDTDMMAGKVNKEEFLQGYDMMDDDKIMECVEVYEKYRGF